MSLQPTKYAAFISYRHVEPDRSWASRLHTLLETYRTPKGLVEGGVPDKLGRVFRDEEELAASADLSAEIDAALEQSAYLIVVCSPQTPRSKWINAEVARFRELGRHDRILALLIDGEPRTSFPPALCELRKTEVVDGAAVERVEIVEPLAADVRPRAGQSAADLRNLAQLRFAATILGVSFDELRQRDLQRRLRNARWVAGLTATISILFLGLVLLAWQQRQVAVAAQAKAQDLSTKNLGLAQEADTKRVAAETANSQLEESLVNSFLNQLYVAEGARDSGRLDEAVCWYLRAYQTAPSSRKDLRDSARMLISAWSRHVGIAHLNHGPLTALGFTADGKTMLTGSEVGTAQLWNARTGESIGVPMLHNAPVLAVDFSADGRIVATGSGSRPLGIQEAGEARLWDARTGKALGEPIKHDASVRAVALSSDGKLLVTGAADSVAQVWDAHTGKPLGKPLQHDDAVWIAEFSPDNTMVLTGSGRFKKRDWTNPSVPAPPGGLPSEEGDTSRGEARFWNAQTGDGVGESLKFEAPVMAVVFSVKGEKALAGSRDGTAQLWDTSTQKPVGTPLQHQGGVTDVQFSPDGQTVATSSFDTTVQLWKVSSCEPLNGPLQHEGPVWITRFTPDGGLLVTGSGDKTVRRWNAQTGQLIGDPLRHEDSLFAMTTTADGQELVSVTDGGIARLWNIHAGEPRQSFSHEGMVWSAAFSPDGRIAVTGSGDAVPQPDTTQKFEARIWDVRTGDLRGNPLVHSSPVWAVAFSPNGQMVVTGSGGSFGEKTAEARLWDVDTGKPHGKPMPHTAPVLSAMFSPDGRMVLTGSSDNSARIWDAQTCELQGEPMLHTAAVLSATFSPDGRMVLTGSRDKTARVWDAKTGLPLGEEMLHPSDVGAVAFSPDCKVVLTGSDDHTARLWDAQTGESRGEPMRHEGYGSVEAVAFSPDGKLVLTGATDNTARLWDARTGMPHGEPMRHPDDVQTAAFNKGANKAYQGGVLAVAFSPDGKVIVTASADTTARFWDVTTSQPCGEPMRHNGWVNGVSFSPDGRTVLTASQDGDARLWDVPRPALDEPKRLQLSVEVRTGLHFDERGNIKRLTSDKLLGRIQQLEQLGGFSDTR